MESLTGPRARRTVALLMLVVLTFTTSCTLPLWARAPAYVTVPVLLCATFCGILAVLDDEVGRGRGAATPLLLVIAPRRRRLLQRRLEEERWHERRRLGRDLHDGVQQHLYALGTCLAVAREQTRGQPAGATIDNACRQLAELLPLFRSIVHDLAPPELAQYGLGPAIHALVERQPIPIEARVSRERVAVEIEYMAYLVVCEALTNVLKHADASRVHLETDVCDGDLVVTVSDDGKGAADLTRGTGLAGLCDRVQSIGGRLELDSPPRVGTTIKVRIPCG